MLKFVPYRNKHDADGHGLLGINLYIIAFNYENRIFYDTFTPIRAQNFDLEGRIFARMSVFKKCANYITITFSLHKI